MIRSVLVLIVDAALHLFAEYEEDKVEEIRHSKAGTRWIAVGSEAIDDERERLAGERRETVRTGKVAANELKELLRTEALAEKS